MITDINQLDLTKSYTYADYLTWQFSEMVELIKGKIFKMSPAPSDLHQNLSSNLHGIFFQYLKKKNCKVFSAPYDVRLTRTVKDEEVTTVVQPDICIICDQSKRDARGCNGAPDLIIEILSPATSKKDLSYKFDLYEEAGVREYWIVYPFEQIIEVFYLQNEKYQLIKKFFADESIPVNIFEGLEIDLKEVFED
jgi:Uma2 family endonuclease